MQAIYKREMQSYFLTPVGYVFMGVFLMIAGIIFYLMNLAVRSSDLLMFLGQLSFVWMLLTPVLTMRLLAEERQKKTDQLLLTSPVSQLAIVCGKYLAAVSVMVVTVLFINVYTVIVLLYGKVYFSEWLIGMLGFVLQGCAFLAVNLYISGLMQSQVTASICAFGVNLFMWIVDQFAVQITTPWLYNSLSFLSLYKRYEPFLLGQFSIASIVYYISFILFFMMASVRHLDVRRVRGA